METNCQFDVLVEVDVGGNRCGVASEKASSLVKSVKWSRAPYKKSHRHWKPKKKKKKQNEEKKQQGKPQPKSNSFSIKRLTRRRIMESTTGRLVFKGLHCYHGGNQHVRSYDDRKVAVEKVCEKVKFVVEDLKKHGLPAPSGTKKQTAKQTNKQKKKKKKKKKKLRRKIYEKRPKRKRRNNPEINIGPPFFFFFLTVCSF